MAPQDTDNVNKMFKQNQVNEAQRADSVRKSPTNDEVDALVFGSTVGIVRPAIIEKHRAEFPLLVAAASYSIQVVRPSDG
jgi:hypothetical protein